MKKLNNLAENFIVDFENSIIESLIKSSKEEFSKALNNYTEYVSEQKRQSLERKTLGHHPFKQTIAGVQEIISYIFLNFINTSDFKDEHVSHYLKLLTYAVPIQDCMLLLWSQDKREPVFQLFNSEKTEITEHMYDSLMSYLSPYIYNNNVPKSSYQKEDYLIRQKEEFFYFQKNYVLLKELNDISPKSDKTLKRAKL